MISERNRLFVEPYEPRVYLYDCLPQEAQLAVAQYFGVDGEAWDEPVYPVTAAQLPKITKAHWDEAFGYAVVPLDALVAQVMSDAGMEEWGTFEEYHAWYADPAKQFSAKGGKEYTSDLWPVYLSCYEDETLEDGWHRFHMYYKRKLLHVPCLYTARK